MARTAKSRKNLFGFGEKKVTTYKHRGSTRRDISSLAFKAGQRSGDTGLFSSWADSKHLRENWDREALKQFEKSYRDGVEKGEEKERRIEEKREAKEEKREAKAKAKEELQEVQSDVIEALAGLGMSRSQAKALARSKYHSGDSFGELFNRIMKRSPSLGNPAKFDRCVSDVSKSLKKERRPGNAYAICTAAGARNPKAIRDMSASEINRALDRLDKQSSKVTDAFIASGRGHERPSDYLRLSDPLSKRAKAIHDARTDLQIEIERRYGPGAPSRLPKGFGSIRINPKSRRNPLESAKKAYEDYTGLPATKVTEVKGQTHRHSTVFKTGQLVCLDVVLPTGKSIPLIAPGFSFEPNRFLRLDLRHSQEAEDADATWIFDPAAKEKTVMVTFSEDGRQMMFTGGDQSMPLEALGFGDRDMRDNMFIGTIIEITYRMKKKFEADGKEEVDFHHPFGAQGSAGILPLLGYYLRTKQMFSIGGRYKIAPVRSDIGASPGIIG